MPTQRRSRSGYGDNIDYLSELGGPAYDPFSQQTNVGLGIRNAIGMALEYDQWKREQAAKLAESQLKQRTAETQIEQMEAETQRMKKPTVQEQEWSWEQTLTPEQRGVMHGYVAPPQPPKGVAKFSPTSKQFGEMLKYFGMTAKDWSALNTLDQNANVELFQKELERRHEADVARIREEGSGSSRIRSLKQELNRQYGILRVNLKKAEDAVKAGDLAMQPEVDRLNEALRRHADISTLNPELLDETSAEEARQIFLEATGGGNSTEGKNEKLNMYRRATGFKGSDAELQQWVDKYYKSIAGK